jgi:hypothetical protein
MAFVNRLAYAAVVAAAACGDKTAHITIETTEPPALVAFRNESSAQWQSLVTQGTSTFHVVATGAYRVVVACSTSSTGGIIAEIARTPDDDPVIQYPCQSGAFVVTGQMQQPGAVAIGTTTAINPTTTAPWNFSLPGPMSSFDLVMLFRDPASAPRIAIRRDVALSGDTNLGRLDPATENAQAMVPTSFTASGLASSETRSVTVNLHTASTSAILTALGAPNTWDAALVPDAILRSTDRENIALLATSISGTQTQFRSVGRDVRVGGATSLALPEPIGSVVFDMTAARLSATLPSTADYDRFALLRQARSTGQGTTGQTASFSRSFLEATGGTGAVLELDSVPGYPPDWRFDPASPQLRQAILIRDSTTGDSTSAGVSQSNVMITGFRAPDVPLGDAAAVAAALDLARLVTDDAVVLAPR